MYYILSSFLSFLYMSSLNNMLQNHVPFSTSCLIPIHINTNALFYVIYKINDQQKISVRICGYQYACPIKKLRMKIITCKVVLKNFGTFE